MFYITLSTVPDSIELKNKHMKKILLRSLVAAIILLIGASFYHADINIKNWGKTTRSGMIFIWLVILVGLTLREKFISRNK